MFIDPINHALFGNEVRFFDQNILWKNRDFQSSDVFDVAGLAAASILSAGLALSQYVSGTSSPQLQIKIDQRLAYLWFGGSVRPLGWTIASPWDDLAGDYQTSDGWIRLHTNAPHHRKIVHDLLGDLNRDDMADEISKWSAARLEDLIVSNGGAAAQLLGLQEWGRHKNGATLLHEPLIHFQYFDCDNLDIVVDLKRPLRGLKVLDLTRILAGPVATRFLAAFGANVLRIDPPFWDEGDHVIDMTPGKRCATLDFTRSDDLQMLKSLISEADVMVHGLRADALDRIGLSDEERRLLNPRLIDVSLNAYGWKGSWHDRRGFDSLVQMSTGIAAHGMSVAGSLKPRPLSVQALDHATGYLMAASVLKGLHKAKQNGVALTAKLSLAATAQLLMTTFKTVFGSGLPLEGVHDLSCDIEHTSWGDVKRLKAPMSIEGIDMYWSRPANRLHSSHPMF